MVVDCRCLLLTTTMLFVVGDAGVDNSRWLVVWVELVGRLGWVGLVGFEDRIDV